MADAADASPNLPPLSLAEFLAQTRAERFLSLQDGQLVCLDPESPEAQTLYQQALAAIAAGAVSLPSPLRPSDG